MKFVLLVLVVAIDVASSAKIACFPFVGGSQYLVMRRIADELVERGHEVRLTRSAAFIQAQNASATVPADFNLQYVVSKTEYSMQFSVKLWKAKMIAVSTMKFLR